jgi:hypothetical protein
MVVYIINNRCKQIGAVSVELQVLRGLMLYALEDYDLIFMASNDSEIWIFLDKF